MNRHFEDTRYYLKRAGETAKKGVTEELEPIRERVEERLGVDEPDPDPGRVEQLRTALKDLGERAEGEAKDAIQEARRKLDPVTAEPAEDNS